MDHPHVMVHTDTRSLPGSSCSYLQFITSLRRFAMDNHFKTSHCTALNRLLCTGILRPQVNKRLKLSFMYNIETLHELLKCVVCFETASKFVLLLVFTDDSTAYLPVCNETRETEVQQSFTGTFLRPGTGLELEKYRDK